MLTQGSRLGISPEFSGLLLSERMVFIALNPARGIEPKMPDSEDSTTAQKKLKIKDIHSHFFLFFHSDNWLS